MCGIPAHMPAPPRPQADHVTSQRARGSGPQALSPGRLHARTGLWSSLWKLRWTATLCRGITHTFLWISRITRKILKLLAGNPCASPPAKSTNSVTAKAEVLPGGNSRNAGETRAAGKPGNRDFSCHFQAGRTVADRQEAGQPASPVRLGQVGPLRLILGGAPSAYPEPPLRVLGGVPSRPPPPPPPSAGAAIPPRGSPLQVPRVTLAPAAYVSRRRFMNTVDRGRYVAEIDRDPGGRAPEPDKSPARTHVNSVKVNDDHDQCDPWCCRCVLSRREASRRRPGAGCTRRREPTRPHAPPAPPHDAETANRQLTSGRAAGTPPAPPPPAPPPRPPATPAAPPSRAPRAASGCG